ncbi:hypothetical protein [Tessaracoccus aquimaris]|uniref:hypothetical protein n=1 Tax=Tessaracoccus aquimaris TaxID=1332264 RepID=UPI001876CBF1|nr:hypothetical protein [Tessaracoccus aquimaris]
MLDLILKGLIVVVCGVFAVLGNGLIRWALRRIGGAPAQDEVRETRANLGLIEAEKELPGGRWVGVLERASIYACILSGFPAGIAVVLGVKGLGRYAELVTDEPRSRKGELFIIGTFLSLLWAGLWAGVGYWGVRAW